MTFCNWYYKQINIQYNTILWYKPITFRFKTSSSVPILDILAYLIRTPCVCLCLCVNGGLEKRNEDNLNHWPCSMAWRWVMTVLMRYLLLNNIAWGWIPTLPEWPTQCNSNDWITNFMCGRKGTMARINHLYQAYVSVYRILGLAEPHFHQSSPSHRKLLPKLRSLTLQT